MRGPSSIGVHQCHDTPFIPASHVYCNKLSVKVKCEFCSVFVFIYCTYPIRIKAVNNSFLAGVRLDVSL